MKYLIFIFICLNTSCEVKTQGDTYPKEINTKSLMRQYDVAKWEMYLMHLDKRCIFNDYIPIKDTPLLSSLDLRFEKLVRLHDTVHFEFRFYYDSIRCDAGSLYNYMILKTGVSFKDTTTKVLYYIDGSTAINTGMRYVSPAITGQRKLFINKNINLFNPWFRNELKRKGFAD